MSTVETVQLRISCRYGRSLRPCMWKPLGITVVSIPYGIRYIKSSFWPGLQFDSLAELNRQALAWCEEANHRVHGTTREIPAVRFPHEGLTPLNSQPDYDTSYVSHRQVAKDRLLSYRGNRYSVPHAYAGGSVAVREPLDGDLIRVFISRT